jgi:hypothetical protein
MMHSTLTDSMDTQGLNDWFTKNGRDRREFKSILGEEREIERTVLKAANPDEVPNQLRLMMMSSSDERRRLASEFPHKSMFEIETPCTPTTPIRLPTM